MTRRPFLVPGTQRHPFEIFLLIACVAAGIPLLFGAPPPTSISASLPDWARLVWAAFLGGGAVVALVGMSWPRKTGTGIILEQIGLVAVGNACLFYAACVLVLVGHSGAFPAGINGAFGIACIWRYVQIELAIRAARKGA